MIFMHPYVCLFIRLWFMTSSEGKICWNYTVWRKGKWLEGILVLKGIYVYKGTCPPTALSFFLSSSRNVLYFIQYNYVSLYLCSPVFSSSAQPSQHPCPRPRLAKSSHLRPHRAKSHPSRAPIRITKSRVSHRALPFHHVVAPSMPVPTPELPSTPAASSLDSVSVPHPSVTLHCIEL
jgi:hypothetical protein